MLFYNKDHPLGSAAYMSEASLKKGLACFFIGWRIVWLRQHEGFGGEKPPFKQSWLAP